MKWFDRILTSLRAAARDLLSEEDTPEEAERVESLLDTAQTRLRVLRSELAQAVAREKRIEIDWRAAWEQANALDAAIDSALRAGQDDVARSKIEEVSRAQVKADELSERYQAAVRVTTRLREEVNALQAQIDEVQRRRTSVTDREQSAASLEQLHQLKREQRKDSATLRDDLKSREEQIAKREDRLSARDDVEHNK
ncbi:MAG: PspA/IM30 family protein [Anaerolineae bacterium]